MVDLKISQLTAATNISSSEFEIVQGGINKRAANTLVYHPSGTDVALADGGTGASLTDPNADRIMFWDDSAGAVTWLAAGTGLSISGTTLAASGLTAVDMQVFTTAGSSTYTPTSGMKYAQVIVIGGGGGSSGWSNANAGRGSGGAGGGAAVAILSAATIGASQTVTVGAGGAAGTSVNSYTGQSGGTSSFGILLSATGGGGGANTDRTYAAGGTGTGGDYNIPGERGGAKHSNLPTGGSGGSTIFAPQQPFTSTFTSAGAITTSGAAGVAPGGGASGSSFDSGTSSNNDGSGFAGAAGAVYIIEYI